MWEYTVSWQEDMQAYFGGATSYYFFIKIMTAVGAEGWDVVNLAWRSLGNVDRRDTILTRW